MTVRSTIGRRGPAVLAMGTGAAVMIGGSLLPWVATGDVRRNSYVLLSLVGRLGFAPDGPVDAALRWWPLLPLLATVAVIAAWWGWPRTGGAVGLVAAGYGGAIAAAVMRAPSELVHVESGPVVTLVGAVVLVAGSVGALVVGWRAGQPVSPTGPGS